jgi:SAM-dependent methyltransferase
MAPTARYDVAIDWYEEHRPALAEHEEDLLRRLLGEGPGRCLDAGCGTGVALAFLQSLGWTPVGVDESEAALARARDRGGDVALADLRSLPFHDASFNAAVSIWTHTDVDDLAAAVGELARVLQPGSPLVYLGAHPCFIGPHSRFVAAEGVPTLYDGYGRRGRYTAEGERYNPEGLRAQVGAVHVPLGEFLSAFVAAGLVLEHFEELALGENEYPYMVALRWRRPA